MFGSAVKRVSPSLFFTSYGAGLSGSSPFSPAPSSRSRRARERTITSFSILPVSAKEPIGIVFTYLTRGLAHAYGCASVRGSLCALGLDAGVRMMVEESTAFLVTEPAIRLRKRSRGLFLFRALRGLHASL